MVIGLALAGSAFAATLQVNTGEVPYTSISDALRDARAGDIIEIGPGVYGGLDLRGRDVTLIAAGAPTDTIITGGVTLSGDSALSGFTLRGSPAVTVTAGAPTLSDVIIQGLGASGLGGVRVLGGSPTMSDCTVEHTSAAYGGGLYVSPGSQLRVQRCTIRDNDATVAGGGIYVDTNAALILMDSDLIENTSDGQGGGIWAGSGATVTISGGSLDNNYSQDGGGIYAYAAAVSLTELTLSENSSGNYGGAIYGTAGVVLTADAASFIANDAYSHGGGVYLDTGFTVDMADTLFDANLSTYGYGGAVYAYNTGTMSFTGATFQENVAYYHGGAVYGYALYDAMTFTDSVFDDNNATYGNGGGVYSYYFSEVVLDGVHMLSNRASSSGGGVYHLAYSDLTITDSLFERNEAVAYSGGGVFSLPYQSYSNTVSVRDSILLDNTASTEGGGLYLRSASTVSLLDSDFVDNRAESSNSFGGGVYLNTAVLTTARRSRFSGNDARYGGGVYVSGFLESYTSQEWTNNVFQENRAAAGGAMCQVEAERVGGTLIHNNTFLGNQATEEGGALCLYEGYVDFRNNVVASTPSAAAVHVYDLNSNVYSSFTYNDWYDNADGDYSGELTKVGAYGDGTVREDPGLADWSWNGDPWDDALVPTPDSPLRDAGDSLILDPDGSVSDIGATGGPEALAQDIDGDGYDTTSDCDDDDAEVYPGAMEQWYDGVNQDCSSGSDFDRDGDGYDAADYGGEDCDDANPYVLPEDCGEDTTDTDPDTTIEPDTGTTDTEPDTGDDGTTQQPNQPNSEDPDAKSCSAISAQPTSAFWLLLAVAGLALRRRDLRTGSR